MFRLTCCNARHRLPPPAATKVGTFRFHLPAVKRLLRKIRRLSMYHTRHTDQAGKKSLALLRKCQKRHMSMYRQYQDQFGTDYSPTHPICQSKQLWLHQLMRGTSNKGVFLPIRKTPTDPPIPLTFQTHPARTGLMSLLLTAYHQESGHPRCFEPGQVGCFPNQ